MNNSQVALHTHQALKQSPSREKHAEHIYRYCDHLLTSCTDAITEEDQSQNTKAIHCGHVVGEEVSVAYSYHTTYRALIPPLLDTHVEHKDVERDEDEDASQGEHREDNTCWRVLVAFPWDRIEGRVGGGGEGRRVKGNIVGREGADGHGLWKSKKALTV